MIGKLRGRIDSSDEDSVILDVAGVGYHVFCSSRTLARLPAHGEAAELLIETHVREDHIHLFGFPDSSEREWFRLLLTVQGVGVKMALAILGAFAPADIVQSILAKDTKSLTKISGVGPKLAERLVTELKNKVGKVASGPVAIGAAKSGKASAVLPAPTISEDAMSALVNLGYSRSEAYNAVGKALERIGSDAELEIVIRESLKAAR